MVIVELEHEDEEYSKTVPVLLKDLPVAAAHVLLVELHVTAVLNHIQGPAPDTLNPATPSQ